MTDCALQITKIGSETCDLHVEEDCQYNGELLEKVPDGEITSADLCQESCKISAPDCNYWIFHRIENSCILKRDGNRICKVWGGPKQPSFDHCKNQSMSRHELGFA